MDKVRTILITLALMLSFSCHNTNGANILVLLPTFSPSHLIIEMAVARAMSESNHNVTIVTVLPLKSEWLHPSMTHVIVEAGFLDVNVAINATRGSALEKIFKAFDMVTDMTQALGLALDDPKMKELITNPGNKFDLMLYGYFYCDFFMGLAEHFNCPVALLWPNVPIGIISKLIGNPLEMTYAPVSLMLPVPADGNFGFLFRLKNLMAEIFELIMIKSQNKLIDDIYRKHFPADKYVSLEKVKQRVSMVLFSHHFSEKPARSLVPGMIEIGGIHLNENPKPLPKDIETFVSGAEHGVIYFSLGTNIKEGNLHPNVLNKIYNVLSKLPQRVLWKCDDESNVLGNSTNILFRKWLPQGDILGHPNVKLFFGHGGKGGITEAKFYGVPMVGLPVFADQPMNMDEVVAKGYGISINHDESLSEEIIQKTVMEVLSNPKYANNVKRFSNLYRDRPLKIKDNAVYWLEYLIRYKGAPHMQSPLKTMSFVEKMNLDVYATLLLVLYLILKVLHLVTKRIFRCLKPCSNNNLKSKRD
ncbi:UDP-glycosyltransferase UGT5-like [Musca autumnalis]|uniref:UDP-glycosyltransferase UGT5-like n=1 Tax=Musca autumnalis TaxID=221902 RepID=UPI003CF0F693